MMAIKPGDSSYQKYKDTVRKIHTNLCVILRIISSTGQIHYEKLDELNKETSLLIAQKLPWVFINFTLHGVFHHSAELIYINNGWSIGTLSEQPQFARTTSPILQLTDAMSRLLERSHPGIINHQKQFHNKNTCQICSGRHKTVNHTKCSSETQTSCLVMFDSLVSEYIIE